MFEWLVPFKDESFKKHDKYSIKNCNVVKEKWNPETTFIARIILKAGHEWALIWKLYSAVVLLSILEFVMYFLPGFWNL
jgi:hypothetical protein